MDNGEEEEIDTDSEDEEKELGEENVSEEEKGRGSDKEEDAFISPLGNPKKRKADQALLQEEAQILKTHGPDPPISLAKEMIEILVERSGEVIRNNRRRAWRNFNMDTARLGIVKELLNIQVLEDLDGRTHFDELIDLDMLVMFDNMCEIGFNLLNNAKNCLIDNLLSIKWLFQEIEALKDKNNQDNSQNTCRDQEIIGKKIDQDGSQKINSGQDTKDGKEDRLSLVKQKVQIL